MKLFHGSDVEIEKIDLSKSRVGKDFGCGFYLSADKNQALRQAENTAFRHQSLTPIISTFEFDEKFLYSPELKVLRFENYSVEWANFILMNRQNKTRTQVHEYDIVFGPIANDTVGVQIRRFLEKYIDIQTLVDELKFNRGITFQYFFGTEKAISYLDKL